MTRFTLPLTVFFLSCFTGCMSMGPWTIARDRFDYAAAISESWKSQTLLNLVKIRYADAPVFLDVASVINQYALRSSTHLRSVEPGGRVVLVLRFSLAKEGH